MIAGGTTADPSRPSGPGIYDYLTGGAENFAADRELAREILAQYPYLKQIAVDNRAFILRAAAWVASVKGIRQFLDIGAGLPAQRALHDAVRDAGPAARVAYVDRDPTVAYLLRSAQAAERWEGTAVTEADAEDPASVLADPALREVIDLGQKTALIFGGTLSAMSADSARACVAGFASELAPGSAVIISCASFTSREQGDAFAAMFAPACGWRSHDPADIASFFGDAEIIGGKAGDIRRWLLAADSDCREARALGGVGLLG